MKKALLILAFVMITLFIAIGSVHAQEKTGVVGTWTGYAIVGDGSRLDFVFTVAKGEEGLTAKITGEAETILEIPARNVAFADNKLSFDIDYPNGMEVVPVKVTLTLDGDSLKGLWTDPGGSSDIVELVRKKIDRISTISGSAAITDSSAPTPRSPRRTRAIGCGR